MSVVVGRWEPKRAQMRGTPEAWQQAVDALEVHDPSLSYSNQQLRRRLAARIRKEGIRPGSEVVSISMTHDEARMVLAALRDTRT